MWGQNTGYGDLIFESTEGQRSRDFMGVCISDAVFDPEPSARGSNRCFATGDFLAVPGSRESRDIESEIRARGRSHLEFYWWRDHTWPLRKARLAFIAKPHGGFPTSMVVDGDV